ncbi:unnamed protein product [Durusdinium trenchii]|uniref:alpha-amylase n=1 Tax=Durusdinium trenchii TaxID=1381693 RepID=A0ABP0NMU3_9DINO
MLEILKDAVLRLDSQAPFPTLSLWLCLAWPLPALLFWLAEYCTRRRRVTTASGSSEGDEEEVFVPMEVERESSRIHPGQFKVILASLEHSLPHLGCKAQAGGLGKVMDLVARHHPTDLLMVHPKLKEDETLKYSHDLELPSLSITVDNQQQDVRVLYCKPPADDSPTRSRRGFLLLSHSWFEERPKTAIYPNPMTRRKVLRFYSLWNQAVGKLLELYKPDIFHCPDFHTCMAPWYAIASDQLNLRVLLVLHNAEYQGSVSTDMLGRAHCEKVAVIFNVSPDFVRQHLMAEGRFNMLKAGVDFLLERQEGRGACAVSEYYAFECHARYSIFWQLPGIRGIDNPMLEEEREVLDKDLTEKKQEAKREAQSRFGLNVEPDARLFVSLGRLVRQKGVDILADVAEWLLSSYPEAQLLVIGPPADGFGFYAQRKLEALAEKAAFKGRLSVHSKFIVVPPCVKWAADFCLMPSRDEPFGYVDVEFAWRGAVIVGAQAGGLGKVPGFYYVQQNRENLARLRRELRTAVQRAMAATPSKVREMSRLALRSSFPLAEWQDALSSAYRGLRRDLSVDGIELSDVSSPGLRRGASGSPEGERREWFPEEVCKDLLVQSQPAEHEHVHEDVTDEEFFWQELTEEEISDRVTQQLDESRNDSTPLNIEIILQRIGIERSKERETGTIAKWLVEPWRGTARIHWLVSCAYISCPVSSLLVLVVAMEWGIRGSAQLPEWFKRFSWFKIVFGNGGLNPPILNMLLFSTTALANAIGAPFWAALATKVQPRLLLAVAMLLQVPLLITMLTVHRPNVSLATIVVFLQGLSSSGSLIFICFNFMLSIKADVSHAAYRMGILEMVRQAVTWFITAYVFLVSPSTQVGSKEEPLPAAVYWLLVPICVAVVLTTIIPGFLFLLAPGPYRDDCLPSWDLKNFWKKRSFVVLSISDVLGCLALFPSTCYIQWWLANGWRGVDLAILSIFFALSLAGVTVIWAKALGSAIIHGFALLMGVTLLLPPASMLRAIVQEEISTYTFLGRSDVALLICCFSLILEGVRASSAWAVKVRVLNSRWRLLSYGTVVVSIQAVMSMFSPFLCEYMARRNSSTFISANQKELADAAVVTMVPLSLLQFALQICAAPYIRQDLGVASSRSLYRGRSGAEGHMCPSLKLKHQIRWRRLPPQMAVLCGCLLGLAALLTELHLIQRPSPFAPVRRCHFGLHRLACRCVADETDTRPADEFASWRKGSYGPNQFGYSTTGRYNCQVRMRILGGDTFSFWPRGRCQVWRCQEGMTDGQQVTGQEIWSRHCNVSGQNLVIAHLFEWPWPDIATECETYLGKAGFNVVQISPPTEHVIGDSWSTRYQPVSFKLDSRGGSEEDFVDMVWRCKQAGVSIMVDAILNHMASPTAQIPREDRDAGKTCGGQEESATISKTPCEGWSFTPYGNREFLHGTADLDRFERVDFHHYEGNMESNCGVPPWTNNRFLCDLYGLVDLDTESVVVQGLLQNFLKLLFERGITMLRLDAAMHVYPESFLAIMESFPFDYVVQEFFPGPLKFEKDTLAKASQVGTFTNFDFGTQVAQVLFDTLNDGVWKNASDRFGDLLHIGNPTPDCAYQICESVYPPDLALVFIDNHDQQRQLWKPAKGGPPSSPVCRWNGKDIGDCRPMYKHGLEYNLAQLFMLAWPYGDAVRIMSSYAFEDFDQGPPGVRNGSARDRPSSPLKGCRSTPTSSPVTKRYDKDVVNLWVCEHRWQGVSGLVRLRRLLRPDREAIHRVQTWSDQLGHAAFSIDHVAFVALNRGFNWETKQGSNETFSLVGMQSFLPGGHYCDLAMAIGPVSERWDGACFNGMESAIVVHMNGTILQGEVVPSHVVALHTNWANLSNVTDESETVILA